MEFVPKNHSLADGLITCVSERDSLMSIWMGRMVAAEVRVCVCVCWTGGRGRVRLNEPH